MLIRSMTLLTLALIAATSAVATGYPADEPRPTLTADPTLDIENCWVAPEWRND